MSRKIRDFGNLLLIGVLATHGASVAHAGDLPIPAPVAGAFGPAGLAAAAAVYVGYRMYRNLRG